MGCQLQKSQARLKDSSSQSNTHLICSKEAKVQDILKQLSQTQLRTKSKSSASREQTSATKNSKRLGKKLSYDKSDQNFHQTGLLKIKQLIQQNQVLDVTPKFRRQKQKNLSKSVEYLPPSWQSFENQKKSDLFYQGSTQYDIRRHSNSQRQSYNENKVM